MSVNIIPVAIGLLLTVIAVIIILYNIVYLISSQKTKGVVVRMVSFTGGDSTKYSPVFQFKTTDGRTIEVEDSQASTPPRFHVGEQVDVLYNPQNPSRARLGKNLFFTPLFLGGIGLCFICVGSIVLMLK